MSSPLSGAMACCGPLGAHRLVHPEGWGGGRPGGKGHVHRGRPAGGESDHGAAKCATHLPIIYRLAAARCRACALPCDRAGRGRGRRREWPGGRGGTPGRAAGRQRGRQAACRAGPQVPCTRRRKASRAHCGTTQLPIWRIRSKASGGFF